MSRTMFFLFVLLTFKSFSQEKDLNYFMVRAQKNSPLIVDYSNQIKAAQFDSLLYRAKRKPQFSATLNGTYAPVSNGYGYDTALSNGQTLNGMVGVDQKIFGNAQLASQSDSYRLIRESLSIKKKIAARDLDKAITAQYITTSGISEQLLYNWKMSDLLREEEKILRKLTQNSVYRQTDYLVFSTAVKQQELVLLQLRQQYRNDLALLNYLSGEIDTTFISLKKPDIALVKLKTSEDNIFLSQYKADSLKLVNEYKLIDSNYKPSLSLHSDAGYSSSFAYQAYKNFGFSVGFDLLIPIYDGGQRSLSYQKNETALATVSAYKANFERQIKQQLAMLDLKLKQAAEIDKQMQSQLGMIEALIEANRKLMLSGDAQITEYVIALGNLININNTLSQNSITRLQIINEINYWTTNE